MNNNSSEKLDESNRCNVYSMLQKHKNWENSRVITVSTPWSVSVFLCIPTLKEEEKENLTARISGKRVETTDNSIICNKHGDRNIETFRDRNLISLGAAILTMRSTGTNSIPTLAASRNKITWRIEEQTKKKVQKKGLMERCR